MTCHDDDIFAAAVRSPEVIYDATSVSFCKNSRYFVSTGYCNGKLCGWHMFLEATNGTTISEMFCDKSIDASEGLVFSSVESLSFPKVEQNV